MTGGARKPVSMYDTEIIFKNELGEVLFTEKNVIVLGGRRFTLEKIFDITASKSGVPYNKKTINEVLGNTVDDNAYAGENGEFGPQKESCVCLFGVGIGGSESELGSVANPSAAEHNLYNMIPFRYLSDGEELEQEDKKKYFMKVVGSPTTAVEEGYTGYFMKRFEPRVVGNNPGVIVPDVVITDGNGDMFDPNVTNPQPTYGDSSASYDLDAGVDAYIEINLKIDTMDIVEYFDVKFGEERPRVNELGLFFGHPLKIGDDIVDYGGVECFSKLTFENEIVSETKVLNIVYRIYI